MDIEKAKDKAVEVLVTQGRLSVVRDEIAQLRAQYNAAGQAVENAVKDQNRKKIVCENAMACLKNAQDSKKEANKALEQAKDNIKMAEAVLASTTNVLADAKDVLGKTFNVIETTGESQKAIADKITEKSAEEKEVLESLNKVKSELREMGIDIGIVDRQPHVTVL